MTRFTAPSFIALAVAAFGPANAAVIVSNTDKTDIADLISAFRDQAPAARAEYALAVAPGVRPGVSSTGQADAAVTKGAAYPAVPMGAAPGVPDTVPLAWAVPGMDRLDGMGRLKVISEDRVAPLIGTIGAGDVRNAKPGRTVFVAAGSAVGFNDGAGAASGFRRSTVAGGYAPSGSSTATITVAGAAIMAKAGTTAPYIATAAVSDRPAAPVEAVPTLTATTRPTSTLGYTFTSTAPAAQAPAPRAAGTQTADATASFSTAVTASGPAAASMHAALTRPETFGVIKLSALRQELPNLEEFLTAEAGGEQFRSVNATATLRKLIELSQASYTPDSNDLVDGHKRLISASVSVDPSGAAARYLASIANLVPIPDRNRSIEAFAVNTPGTRTTNGARSTVFNPITGRILASAGPLNDALSLR